MDIMSPQDVYEAYRMLLAHNMQASYTRVAEEDGGLSVDVAINGAMGMMDFGLFLAKQHPVTAAALRYAIEEREAVKGGVSAEQAVDAVVERFEKIVAKMQQPE